MEYSTVINGLPVNAVYSEDSVNNIFLPLLKTLTEMQKASGRRLIVFLAAPPGTGKSTLCAFLEKLSRETEGITPICSIGMDGFHKRQKYLLSHSAEIGGREVKLVDIKGNPITFDVEKLSSKLEEIKGGGKVLWPLYDRLLHDPVEDAVEVSGDIVLIEGNYLLLNSDGWRTLREFADYSVYIRAEIDDLRERLIDRKTASGTPKDKAAVFVENSDLVNAKICNSLSFGADLQLRMTKYGEYVNA